MGNGINLTAILIANGIALVLAAQLLFGNNWRRVKQDPEYRVLKGLIITIAAACISDPLVFWADGHPGAFFRFIVYAGNTFQYLVNMVIGVAWIYMVSRHLTGKIDKLQKIFVGVLSTIGVVTLIVNFFVPVVFSVDANSVYQRHALYWLYTVLGGAFMVDGIVIYAVNRVRGGVFKYFPVIQFIVPQAIGIIVQSLFYGVSVVYPAAMIASAGVLCSLKNEALFRDPLTGLYNRTFLNDVANLIEKKGPSLSMSVFIMDMNNFKEINDRFGHVEGDEALRRAAQVLKHTVGSLGSVVRYAGDEFVILLNTKQPEIVEGCAKSIHRAFHEENLSEDKEYDLSVSVGYCPLSEAVPTLDAVLGAADRAMYEEKEKFHSGRDAQS